MTVKYAGMITVFICCTLLGNGLAVSEKRRLERSEALRDLFYFIYREIECFRTPLGDIYMKCSSEKLSKIGFIADMRNESLRYALENMKESLSYKEETVEALLDFAEGLGKSEYSDQVSRCKYVISIMDDDLKRSREAYPKNRKMCTSLGLLSGIMIIILMI
jgi:stage III sporulation protein AB